MTPKQRPCSIIAVVFEVFEAHTSASGGASEAPLKSETVMPWIRSPAREVMIVTPLAQEPSAALNSSAVIAIDGLLSILYALDAPYASPKR